MCMWFQLLLHTVATHVTYGCYPPRTVAASRHTWLQVRYLAARLGDGGEYASASVGIISLGGIEQAHRASSI